MHCRRIHRGLSRRAGTQIGARQLALWLLCLTACDAELYHDLDEHAANESLLSLRQAGLAADKKPSGRSTRGPVYTLVVPRRDEDRALSVLRELGLPTKAPSLGGDKLALLPGEVKAAQLRERELTLAETLMSLPQVSFARVHLAFAEADPLLPTAQLRPTASVLLRLRGEPSVKATDIAELVARSVVGLDAADVTVLLAKAPSLAQPVPRSTGSSSLLVVLGSLCGLLAGAVAALALALFRKRARDAQPQKTEHSLQALTGS